MFIMDFDHVLCLYPLSPFLSSFLLFFFFCLLRFTVYLRFLTGYWVNDSFVMRRSSLSVVTLPGKMPLPSKVNFLCTVREGWALKSSAPLP